MSKVSRGFSQASLPKVQLNQTGKSGGSGRSSSTQTTKEAEEAFLQGDSSVLEEASEKRKKKLKKKGEEAGFYIPKRGEKTGTNIQARVERRLEGRKGSSSAQEADSIEGMTATRGVSSRPILQTSDASLTSSAKQKTNSTEQTLGVTSKKESAVFDDGLPRVGLFEE